MIKHDKKALKRSFWGALGRLIGVMMGAGAGSLLYQTLGSASGLSIGLATGLAVVGFLLIWFAEYERDISGSDL
jgi:uncharacterized membrane protein YccC